MNTGKMKRKFRVCQVATVQTAVYETCDATGNNTNNTSLESANLQTRDQQNVIATKTQLVPQLNNCLGNITSNVADAREKFYEECKKRFQPYRTRLDRLMEETNQQSCTKKLKEGRRMLQEQDQKVFDIMQSAFQDERELANKDREFMEEWNKLS